MYVETDFILALLKDDDWLQQRAEEVYREKKEELWSSRYTLIELLILSYREEWNPVRIISGATELVEIRGSTDELKAAASHMEQNDYTPFDALHLTASGDEKIVSSDQSYDSHTDRLELEKKGE